MYDLEAGAPPSWISATIDLTPLRSSSRAYLLTVSTSSWNFSPLTPSAETMSGVPSRVTPMNPILTPFFFHTVYGLRIGLPVFSSVTLAARYGKSAPLNLRPLV